MPRVTTPKGLKPTGKQLKLSTFFSPSPTQKEVTSGIRASTLAKGDSNTPEKNGGVGEQGQDPCLTPPLKRTKLTDVFNKEENGCETTPVQEGERKQPAPLTPEIRNRINDNATKARLIRASKELTILDANMGPSWFTALEAEFKKDYFIKLNNFVVSSRLRNTVFPPPDNVWEWTKQVPVQDIKVVILGQDPYHGPNQAHGLCFSVKKGVNPPPSLKNMYLELADDVEGFQEPKHGCLSGWAQQGVLLLNAVLTVDKGQPNSHKDKGWENITDSVIRYISKNLHSVVFFLWGAYANKKGAIVDKKKHLVLSSAHPSPFSARNGFFGCKHFSKCNDYLEKNGRTPIDWNSLP